MAFAWNLVLKFHDCPCCLASPHHPHYLALSTSLYLRGMSSTKGWLLGRLHLQQGFGVGGTTIIIATLSM